MPPQIHYEEVPIASLNQTVVLSNEGSSQAASARQGRSPEAQHETRQGGSPQVLHEYECISDVRSYENIPVTDGYQDPLKL